jgi:hypothetical protein
MNKKVIIEEGILFTDKKFFKDGDEHEYNCRCSNGQATCFLADDDDKTAPKEIVVKYPKMKELTTKQKDYILEYRGLYDLTHKDIHYGDVMVAYGKIAGAVNEELSKLMTNILFN